MHSAKIRTRNRLLSTPYRVSQTTILSPLRCLLPPRPVRRTLFRLNPRWISKGRRKDDYYYDSTIIHDQRRSFECESTGQTDLERSQARTKRDNGIGSSVVGSTISVPNMTKAKHKESKREQHSTRARLDSANELLREPLTADNPTHPTSHPPFLIPLSLAHPSHCTTFVLQRLITTRLRRTTDGTTITCSLLA